MTDTAPLVPLRLADAVVRRPLIEVAPTRALVRFPGTGRVLVGVGGSVIRQPDPGREDSDLDFLDDTADALAVLLDGGFPLRASVVEVDGVALALCGHASVGKSTVAAAIAAGGHRFVGDAVATVSLGAGVATVRCPPRGPVLWPDAVERLGLDPGLGVAVRAGIPALRFPGPSKPTALPLAGVVALHRGGDGEAAPPARGFDAVTNLARTCWHPFAVAPLGRAAAQFRWAVGVAGAVRSLSVEYPRADADPARTAARVLAAWSEGGA